jgi:ABC-type multidrug transport system fused ATPase/permease subunit
VLFNASIKENLLFANPDATDEECKQALKDANAWDFINEMEGKMETNVGSGGG